MALILNLVALSQLLLLVTHLDWYAGSGDMGQINSCKPALPPGVQRFYRLQYIPATTTFCEIMNRFSDSSQHKLGDKSVSHMEFVLYKVVNNCPQAYDLI